MSKDIKNKVQLITYPNSLGGDLKSLNKVLKQYFNGIFHGVHILPPFPSSGDRGFAPLTYLEIEPDFGSWKDIENIAKDHDILVDLMVNHISKASRYFQDFLKKGMESAYADLFITLDKVWKDGKPVQADIDKMFLRRTLPISTFRIEKTGEEKMVWTTFGKQTPSEQIDLDTNSKQTRQLLYDFFANFSRHGVKIVRLDAVGYITKKPGTSCFFVEPEIYDFLEWIKGIAQSLNIELLPEVHAHYSIQYKLAEKGYWIYDFILPYAILEALVNHSGTRLCRYLAERPHKQFTMLDCHDGIPVKPDLDDLVTTRDAQKIVDVCLERGANLSLIFSDKHKSADGFDVHQIRCSYYSALNNNDDAYIAARAIQLFTPGIPQIYYVTLLGGKNDEASVKRSGEGREINRHNFTFDEIDEAVKLPVVQRQIRLIRFRNEYPAFDGVFSVDNYPDNIVLSWKKENYWCKLEVNLLNYQSAVFYKNGLGETVTRNF